MYKPSGFKLGWNINVIDEIFSSAFVGVIVKLEEADAPCY